SAPKGWYIFSGISHNRFNFKLNNSGSRIGIAQDSTHISFEILYISVNDHYIVSTLGDPLAKGNSSHNDYLANRYKSHIEKIKRMRKCPICNGDLSLFGNCKLNCSKYF
ncbi:MAG: hypothetical protein K2N81_01915, partial [Acetatifactor sp.]|nr:hypothetical protein [Acetatifactor sp.]